MNSAVRNVLITGGRGYIGSVVVPYLRALGYAVTTVDTGWFDQWRLEQAAEDWARGDIRDLTGRWLSGFDAVVHLAALSNDPLGALDPGLTASINLESTVRLALLAREAGVKRFLFASSCSVYGSAGSAWVDESSAAKPLTAYAHSKWAAERHLLELKANGFAPVILRLATVYGFSPSLRLDLVANNLTAWAVATGEVRLQSNGRAWRPLVHVRDVARAIAAALAAPAQSVDGEVFNVGSDDANYTVLEIAEAVCSAVPGAHISFAPRAQADERSYRVHFEKLRQKLPTAIPVVRFETALAELAETLRHLGLDAASMRSACYHRTAQLRELQQAGLLDEALRWQRMSGPERPSSTSEVQ
ncbi:UDP-N-acetylglucosamine 4-epimerase [bacterium HR30]|nr:UDP-N-acetylglucosamine 4-epimerase [bacterium HR30]